MARSETTKCRVGSLAAITSLALVVAACGSSSSSSTASSAASAAPSTSASSAAPATGVAVGTAKSSLGTYLTGASGRAVYIWVADTSGKSACNGSCATAWPPLTTKASPTASGGAMAADLGMITRSDGSKQVTYKGHPLYYYAGDTGAGTTNGQGSSQFGAKWWLIAPSGGQVSSGSSTASSSGGSSTGASSGSSSTSSSGGGGWG